MIKGMHGYVVAGIMGSDRRGIMIKGVHGYVIEGIHIQCNQSKE